MINETQSNLKRTDESSRKTDILHVISGDLWAGAETQFFHTLSSLMNYGKVNFKVVLFNDGILKQKLDESGIEAVLVDEKKLNGLMMLVTLTRLIYRLKPAIIHVHAYKEYILGQIGNILSGNKSAIVRTFHGMNEIYSGLSYKNRVKSRIVQMIERVFLNNSKRINMIAVSEDIQTFLKKSYPRAIVTQINNGISFAPKVPITKCKIKQEYGLSESTFWIGTLARLVEIKNLEMLINVGNKLLMRGIDFRISIFGEGPIKERLQNKIIQYKLEKQVVLEGFKEDIMPILASFDIFVLCSFHEGLPMSLIEAMSLGTPAVCTKVGGIPEIVKDNVSGLLVPSNDVLEMTDAIIRLLNDKKLRCELASNSIQTIKEKYSIESTNLKLIKLYETMLSR